MPEYKFSLSPNVAGEDVSVVDAADDEVDTGTVDSDGTYTATLDVGDYTATAGAYSAGGELQDVVDSDTYRDGSSAAEITYDNTESELTAENVQAALDEIVVRVAALEAP